MSECPIKDCKGIACVSLTVKTQQENQQTAMVCTAHALSMVTRLHNMRTEFNRLVGAGSSEFVAWAVVQEKMKKAEL